MMICLQNLQEPALLKYVAITRAAAAGTPESVGPSLHLRFGIVIGFPVSTNHLSGRQARQGHLSLNTPSEQ